MPQYSRQSMLVAPTRDCTAFINLFKTFRYKHMSFGSNYSRMLDLAMAHLPAEYLLSYLEDILVYSTDPWGTLEHQRKVVQAHTQVGIKIQPKKTKIFQSEVEYLGLKVSIEGVPKMQGDVFISWTHRILYSEVLSFDKLHGWDEEGGKIRVVRRHGEGF